jgi:hypothetical protein
MVCAGTALGLVVGWTASAGPADAAEPPATVTVSPSLLTPRGLEVATTHVTTHLSAVPDGVTPWVAVLPVDNSGPAVTQAPAFITTRSFELALMSGNRADGTWAADVPFTSGMSAHWRLVACTGSEPCQAPAEVEVAGTHVPVVTMAPAQLVTPYSQATVEWRGRVVYADTRAAAAGVRVSLSFSSECWIPYTANESLTSTDATGSFRVMRPVKPWNQTCASVVVPTPDGSNLAVRPAASNQTPRIHVGLTARPSAASGVAGRDIPVNGMVFARQWTPSQSSVHGHPVRLQRHYRDGTWRTVASGTVRSTGRYVVLATPPSRGRFAYRVWFPSSGMHVATVTRPFTLTAS